VSYVIKVVTQSEISGPLSLITDRWLCQSQRAGILTWRSIGVLDEIRTKIYKYIILLINCECIPGRVAWSGPIQISKSNVTLRMSYQGFIIIPLLQYSRL